MRRVIAIGALMLASVAAPAMQEAPSTGAPPTGGSSLIERFLQRDDAPLRSYRAARRLDASNKRFNTEGWLEVQTELIEPRQFRWTVTREGGSSYIRNKVLRKALESETQALNRPAGSSSAFTDANYNFFADEIADDDRARIRIEPRRKDTMLVSGHLLLTTPDADLVQVEGRLAKNPSFWTSRVDIVRRYDRLLGVRVPVEMRSTAQVKIAGRSEFRMVYTYEAINGAPVGVTVDKGR